MKKLFIILAASAMLAVKSQAQVLIGSGATVGANQTTNFTSLAQVGTITLNNVHVSFNYTGSSVTNAALVNGYGRLTFDGTNFFVAPQQWNATNGLIWTPTNQTFAVYAALSITNGQGSPITNLTATMP